MRGGKGNLENRKQLNIRIALLVIIDALSLFVAGYGSLFLRFNGSIEAKYLIHYFNICTVAIIGGIVIFYLLKLYKSLWQFASITELKNIIVATLLSSVFNILVFELSGNSLPKSCYFIYFLLLTMLISICRFSYRFIRSLKYHGKGKPLEKVMVIGAGLAGEKIYREIQTSSYIDKEVVCFIDDDKSKQGQTMHDITIYGGRDKIIEACQKYHVDEILVAMPSVDKKDVAEILNICKETKCKIKNFQVSIR